MVIPLFFSLLLTVPSLHADALPTSDNNPSLISLLGRPLHDEIFPDNWQDGGCNFRTLCCMNMRSSAHLADKINKLSLDPPTTLATLKRILGNFSLVEIMEKTKGEYFQSLRQESDTPKDAMKKMILVERLIELFQREEHGPSDNYPDSPFLTVVQNKFGCSEDSTEIFCQILSEDTGELEPLAQDFIKAYRLATFGTWPTPDTRRNLLEAHSENLNEGIPDGLKLVADKEALLRKINNGEENPLEAEIPLPSPDIMASIRAEKAELEQQIKAIEETEEYIRYQGLLDSINPSLVESCGMREETTTAGSPCLPLPNIDPAIRPVATAISEVQSALGDHPPAADRVMVEPPPLASRPITPPSPVLLPQVPEEEDDSDEEEKQRTEKRQRGLNRARRQRGIWRKYYTIDGDIMGRRPSDSALFARAFIPSIPNLAQTTMGAFTNFNPLYEGAIYNKNWAYLNEEMNKYMQSPQFHTPSQSSFPCPGLYCPGVYDPFAPPSLPLL